MKNNEPTNNSLVSENCSAKTSRSVEESLSKKSSQLVYDDQSTTQTTEDDIGIPYSVCKHRNQSCGIDKEPIFVIVESNSFSNPSSKEMLIDDPTGYKDNLLMKYCEKNMKTDNLPSTSKDTTIPTLNIKECESKEELEVVDINLQSENDISMTDSESDKESIVLAYIRNRDKLLELEGTLLSSKKKVSLLESVPKMETIIEGKRFSTFPSTSKNLLTPTQECSSVEEVLVDEGNKQIKQSINTP
ncbi:hypothetical protein evm_005562 [Chilo suppressalis]|nr:hypothetical protein evm_005562 [Chilo suppressalis]